MDLWGLECKSESDGKQKIVVFSAIDLSDSLNNIGYNLLVSDSGKKIKKAAEEMGFQFELINGDDATQEKFNVLQEDPTIARLVIIAHGQQGTGNAYSVDDLPLKITIDNEIPVIDIVACYASSNPNYKSNSTTIVNTYNPGTSTSYISDDEIWHNQTNEVLNETIPNAILNNISNSSKEPTQKPNKVTKFLMEKLF